MPFLSLFTQRVEVKLFLCAPEQDTDVVTHAWPHSEPPPFRSAPKNLQQRVYDPIEVPWLHVIRLLTSVHFPFPHPPSYLLIEK
jgi:hypothetical protein